MGKNAFLSFPVPPNFDTLFPVFVQDHEKPVKKGQNGAKGREDLERGHGAVLALSRPSNLARFRFLCGSKPIFAPFQTRS